MNFRNIFQNKEPIIGIFVVMTIFASTDVLHAQVVSGSINGHNYVDLGLPSGVLWATCNVGAYAPQQYGSYFAWGETYYKNYYSPGNSVTHEKSFQSIEGDVRYDAASANWHPSWRLPTLEDANELVQRCTWIWTSIAGTNGYKVIGPNGNWIFLPATGYTFEGKFDLIGQCGYYWTSTPDTYNLSGAYSFGFTYYQGIHNVQLAGRSAGRSVRPVSNRVIWKNIGRCTNNFHAIGGCSNFTVTLANEDGNREYKGELSGVYLSVEDGDVIIFGRTVFPTYEYTDFFHIKVKQYGKEVNNNSVWRRVYKGVSSYGSEATLVLDYKNKWVLYNDNNSSILVSAKDFYEVSGSFDL